MNPSFRGTRLIRSWVLLALIALAGIGLARISLDIEVLNLLPADNPVSKGLLLYQQRFLDAGELVVTIQSDSMEHSGAAVDAIVRRFQTRTNLVERLFWQPPWNESIEVSAQFLAYLWLNSPPEKVRTLEESLRPGNLSMVLAATRERMATSLDPRDFMLLPRDPFRLSSVSTESRESLQTPERFFSSADGTFRIVYMYAGVPVRDYDQCHVWVTRVRQEINAALRDAGLADSAKVQLTGRPVFVDEIASGMKSDMSTNAPGTLFMIGLLFYIVHREIRSLILLLATLLIVMIWTALIGAAFLGELNVISIGFASILLGLAEDFGIVLHQEARSHPQASARELRGYAGAGIFWSAITTASAFALLNFSSLPGLRQLGTLVALGILLGAWVMCFLFLPVLLRFARSPFESRSDVSSAKPGYRRRLASICTFILLIGGTAVLLTHRPRLNSSPDVLRPRQSEASRTLTLVQKNLGVAVEPYWVLASGDSISAVEQTLQQLEPILAERVSQGQITSFNLPREIWPRPDWQRQNAPLLQQIAGRQGALHSAALEQGFTTNSFALTDTAANEWRRYSAQNPEWPRGRIAEWLLPKFVSVTPTNYIALGLIYPADSFDPADFLPESLTKNALVSGWQLLGRQVLERVKREVPLISLAVLSIVTLALYLTFRDWTQVALSFAVLALSAIVLLASMAIFNWDWNLINLTSLPLLLGMGIDYSIHIQLTLRRLKGDATATFRLVGRALLLAGSTSIIGFALLGTSSNLGMSSLGRVCALGLTILLIVSVFLLPAWGRSAKSRA